LAAALMRPLSASEQTRLAQARQRVARVAALLYRGLWQLDELARELTADAAPTGVGPPAPRVLHSAEDAATLRRGDSLSLARGPSTDSPADSPVPDPARTEVASTDPFAALAAALPLKRLRVLVLRLARLAARPGRVERQRVAAALTAASPEALEALERHAAAWRDEEDPAGGGSSEDPWSPSDEADANEADADADSLAAELEAILRRDAGAGAGADESSLPLRLDVPVATSGAGPGAAAALWRQLAAQRFGVDPEEVLQAATDDELTFVESRDAAEAGLVVFPLFGRWLAAWRDGSLAAEAADADADATLAWRLTHVTRRSDGTLRLDDVG